MNRTTFVLLLFTLVAPLAHAQPAGPQPLPGNPQPVYPKAAAADAVVGYVELAVAVRRDGRPGSIRTLKHAPAGFGFEKAAKEAIARWRFDPSSAAAGGSYTARFDFRPAVPLPVTRWQSVRNTDVSYPNSGRTLKLQHGWVHTPRWFSDFVFELEFRLLEPGTNAGILIHAQPVGYDGDYAAYRVTLADGASFGLVENRNLASRAVSFDSNAAAAAVRPVGAWQTLRVESTNGRARVAIGGSIISVADEFTQRTGHIGIDVRKGAVEVRAPRVQRLDTFFIARAPETDVIRIPNARSDPAITTPRIKHEVKPSYAARAMRDMKQGWVWLEAVVLVDGSVDAISVTKSLDLDLDQAAVAALRQWKFEPGRKNDQPVPMLVEVEMTFTLK